MKNNFGTITWAKVIQRIAATSKALGENKNGTSQFFLEKSHQVALMEAISNQEIESLKKLCELKTQLTHY